MIRILFSPLPIFPRNFEINIYPLFQSVTSHETVFGFCAVNLGYTIWIIWDQKCSINTLGYSKLLKHVMLGWFFFLIFLRPAKATFTFCVHISALVFSLFRIPNPFSSFHSLIWEKSLAAGIAKASDTLCEHLGNLTVKCREVQQPSRLLSPLRCNCWFISVLGDQYQMSLFKQN